MVGVRLLLLLLLVQEVDTPLHRLRPGRERMRPGWGYRVFVRGNEGFQCGEEVPGEGGTGVGKGIQGRVKPGRGRSGRTSATARTRGRQTTGTSTLRRRGTFGTSATSPVTPGPPCLGPSRTPHPSTVFPVHSVLRFLLPSEGLR